MEIVGAHSQVPLAGGGSIEYANLDHGASAPALRIVRDTVDALLERYASVHRGAGWHSKVCTALYEGARGPVRDFVGGRSDDAVIFTKHTTDSFNLLAHCLPARTTVVVFETEHHAALLPWEDRDGINVIRLTAPASPAEAVSAVDHALRTRPAGPALLVVTGASNVTGEIWPITALAAVARARGARVALDAAQLAPHRPFSIEELGVDYVALSGHKLYAPYGAGALIGRSDWLAQAPSVPRRRRAPPRPSPTTRRSGSRCRIVTRPVRRTFPARWRWPPRATPWLRLIVTAWPPRSRP